VSIESIELRNFTVFKDLKVNFSKGINIIIGENGTGKPNYSRQSMQIFKFLKVRI
jgi:Recombinational DNA repair ATPase (RecF pathway)